MRKTILLVAVSASLLLAGCSKVTPENYNKVKTGMSHAEVEAILGQASGCSQMLGASSCTWGDDNTYIRVKFVADNAAIISSNGL